LSVCWIDAFRKILRYKSFESVKNLALIRVTCVDVIQSLLKKFYFWCHFLTKVTMLDKQCHSCVNSTSYTHVWLQY